MKVNFDYQFIDIFTGAKVNDDGSDKPFTLGAASIRALMSRDPNAKHEDSGEQKVKDFMLAQRIRGYGNVYIVAEKAGRLKQRLAIFYGPMIVGQAWPLLDGSTDEKAA